jgi:hypothetical protein
MADITEIPLDIPEVAEDIAEIVEDSQTNIPDIASEIPSPVEPEKPKAKAKGRPKGAQNKQPSKPRAKKQVKEVEVEESTPMEYQPSSPKRNLKLPTDPSTSEVAAAMLKMLQDQSFSRQNRKQRLYNSWFQ